MYLFFGQRFYQFVPKVVYGLHLRCLEGQLAHFGASASGRSVNLHLHHLTLDDLRLLLDADPNGATESLRQHLSLGHSQTENIY